MPGGFHFSLQRVLEWEEQLLNVELAALSRIQSDVHRLHQLAESWKKELASQQELTLANKDLFGVDLHRLTEHQGTLLRELARVPPIRARLMENLNAQRQRLLTQERKRKTLTRLKERQREEWLVLEQAKESELASELFLAGLVRGGSEPQY